MNKILIVYYSGTYNTTFLVNLLKDKLSNYQVTIYNIFDDFINDDYDYLFILYPIYAFNAPKYFENRIASLPLKDLNYTIIKNSGEGLSFNNSSSKKIIKILQKKNCSLINEYHLLMPYYIIFRHDNRMVKFMLQTNIKYLDYIIQNMDTPEHIKTTFLSNMACSLGKLQRFGAKLNSHLYRIDKTKCNHCLKCLNNCPLKCIQERKGTLKINSNCLMCMRCSSFCPQNAIKIGFLNHWKVNGKYNLTDILNSSIDDIYLEIASKRFKRIYKKYYDKTYQKIGSL